MCNSFLLLFYSPSWPVCNLRDRTSLGVAYSFGEEDEEG